MECEGLPFGFVDMNAAYFPYRNKKQMRQHVECGFNDINLEKKKIMETKKQGKNQ